MKQYQPGEMIGGTYKVLKVFGGEGKSGMGVVYLVSCHDAPAPFVLKGIQDNAALGFDNQRFIKEITAWVTVGWHPNIVRALWSRKIDGVLYVAAEFIVPDDNGWNTLQQHLPLCPLRPKRMLSWMMQICYGLEYACNKGVLAHRDIKPDNIMISAQGLPKVTDFGLARLGEEVRPASRARAFTASNLELTQAGSGFGCLPFMSPEQFIDASTVDCRSDIYSLGMVFFMMASGGRYPYRYPATVKDQDELFQMHAQQMPGSLDSPFADIVYKCLAKTPTERFQTYSELIFALISVGEKLGAPIPRRPDVSEEVTEELFMQAQSYSALGDPAKALECIEKYLHHYPNAYWAWTEKGRLLMGKSDNDEAIKALQKSISLFEDNTHAWNNLGLIYNRQKDFEKAIQAFQTALVNDPQNTGAMMNLAQPLLSSGRLKETVTILQKALKIAPQKSTLLFNASNTAGLIIGKGQAHEAFPLLEDLIHLAPENPVNWQNYAIACITLKKTADALAAFKRLESLEPDNEFALLSLAQYYGENHKFDQAIAYCDKLLAHGKEEIKAYSFKAQFLAFQGRHKEAVSLLQEDALSKHPKSDSIWFVLSEIQLANGDKAGAVKSLFKCGQILYFNPGHPNRKNLPFVKGKLDKLKAELASEND